MSHSRRNSLSVLLTAIFIFIASGISLAQQSSLFSSADCYKLAITRSGIYKISGSFLQQQGVDISRINPEELQLFGHGGGMLPQSLQVPFHTAPPEHAVQVVGGEDGRFDARDYLLFYGEGPHRQGYSREEPPKLIYQKNLYSDTAYYFLTFGQEQGKRITSLPHVQPAGGYITSYDAFAVHEEDLLNLLATKISAGSGREWYGEAMHSGESITLNFETPHALPEGEAVVQLSVVGTDAKGASVELFLNNQSAGRLEVEPVLEGTYNEKGKEAAASFEVSSQLLSGKAALALKLSYQSAGGREAYLNRVLLEYPRQLVFEGEQLMFRSLKSMTQPVSGFQISSALKDVSIWDITEPLLPANQEFTAEDDGLRFGAVTADRLREYIVFHQEQLLLPEWRGVVSQQNIKGGEVPELLIVSHPAFVPEAQRLALFRQEHDGLHARVVTTDQIFLEFSSGAQDVTAIRNYLRYLYDRQPGKLKYLLLFGKCSYDYKDRIAQNTNYVPTYQSRNSTHPIYSYSSDDYFGFLEDEEGDWDESFAGDHTLDIGVGRLPVKSLQEARSLVDKLIYYDSNPATRGDWKNQVLFVADDGDGNRHQLDADELATLVDTSHLVFNTRKLYMDVFSQESIPTGEKAPQMNEAIQEAIRKGVFIVNYTGHGSERQWAHEKVLTTEMISQWNNLDRLPFFVTATCEFGRHDDPALVSGAEQLVLNPKGGAIGIVTTTRPVFSSSNFLINKAFYQQVFRQAAGQYQTLGKVFMDTKNQGLNGRVNRNFSLLADPSMRLAYPADQIVIDSVMTLGADKQYELSDTLKAMARVRLKGRVQLRGHAAVNEQFDGILFLTLFDKASRVSTLGNEGLPMQFEERNSVIHRGKASIRHGLFEIEFVVPRNIVYKDGQGKISLYAVQQQTSGDAHGIYQEVQIGGSAHPFPVDTDPPQISLFMDDTTFVNGGMTAPSSVLLAFLEDEHGINISRQNLAQNLQVSLRKADDGTFSQSLMLNDFFVTETDSYQQGWITYPFHHLEDGKYVLTLQVWDNAGNKSEKKLDFIVRSTDKLAIHGFYNVPNPFSDNTTFVVDHNRPGENLSATLLILNTQGQLLRRLENGSANATTRLNAFFWDGTDQHGHRLTPGMYLARLILTSATDGASEEKVQKIIIIN